MTLADYYPIFSSNNISGVRKEDSGSIKFISNKHTELNYLSINETTDMILNMCSGDESLAQIIQTVAAKYKNVNNADIEKDIISSLERLWRYGVISWKESMHPFRCIKKLSNCCIEQLSDEQVISALKNYEVSDFTQNYSSVETITKLEFANATIIKSWAIFERMYFSLQTDSGEAIICTRYNDTLHGIDCMWLFSQFDLSNEDIELLYSFIIERYTVDFVSGNIIHTDTPLFFYFYSLPKTLANINLTLIGTSKFSHGEKSVELYYYSLKSSLLDKE